MLNNKIIFSLSNQLMKNSKMCSKPSQIKALMFKMLFYLPMILNSKKYGGCVRKSQCWHEIKANSLLMISALMSNNGLNSLPIWGSQGNRSLDMGILVMAIFILILSLMKKRWSGMMRIYSGRSLKGMAVSVQSMEWVYISHNICICRSLLRPWRWWSQ